LKIWQILIEEKALVIFPLTKLIKGKGVIREGWKGGWEKEANWATGKLGSLLDFKTGLEGLKKGRAPS